MNKEKRVDNNIGTVAEPKRGRTKSEDFGTTVFVTLFLLLLLSVPGGLVAGYAWRLFRLGAGW